MPLPGPRTQFGPDPGYRNPENAAPTLFNHWGRPGPVLWPGRTAGLMTVTLRGCVLAAGQIRRLWRQSVDLIPAQGPYSWTMNRTMSDSPVGGVGITRALRYMTHSLYLGAGIDNTRYDQLHTVVKKQHNYKVITVGKGQTRSRPTIRNRMTSFGSRVQTLNQESGAAMNTAAGAGGGGGE